MNEMNAFHMLREAFLLSVLLPAPILILGLVVGVAISFVQAITQIHEPSLVFIPKLAVSTLALLVGGQWMMNLLVQYTTRLLTQLPHVVR